MCKTILKTLTKIKNRTKLKIKTKLDKICERNIGYHWTKSIKLDNYETVKIAEKVSLQNIASEASYVYILNGQNFMQNDKNGQFGEFLKN